MTKIRIFNLPRLVGAFQETWWNNTFSPVAVLRLNVVSITESRVTLEAMSQPNSVLHLSVLPLVEEFGLVVCLWLNQHLGGVKCVMLLKCIIDLCT